MKGCLSTFWTVAKWSLIGLSAIIVILVMLALVIPRSNPSTSRRSIVAVPTFTATPILVPTKAPANTPTPAPPTPIPTPTYTFQEARDHAETIPYRELLRNTEQYIDRTVTYDGKIVQVISEDNGRYEMRIAVSEGAYGIWSDVVLVVCRCAVRPLKDDLVSFVGRVDSRATYTTVLLVEVTVPKIYASDFVIR